MHMHKIKKISSARYMRKLIKINRMIVTFPFSVQALFEDDQWMFKVGISYFHSIQNLCDCSKYNQSNKFRHRNAVC